jgi:nucleotide-binding universal stress UspA family protein
MLQDLVLPVTERLTVLSVAPQSVISGARPDPAFLGVTRSIRERSLADAAAQAESNAKALHTQVPTECVSRWGNPIQQILRLARSEAVDLIVIGAKGHSNLSFLLLGSVSQGVVQHADRPVLIARPGNVGIGSLLIGYDGSRAARNAISFIKRLRFPSRCTVVLCRVIEPFPLLSGTPIAYRRSALAAAEEINDQRHQRAEQSLRAAVADLAGAGIQAEYDVRFGRPDMELDEAALQHGSDLIVVGSRKPSPKRHYLLGSTAEKLMRHSPKSVLIIR